MKILLKNGQVLIAHDITLVVEGNADLYFVKNYRDGVTEIFYLWPDEVAGISGRGGR